MARECPSISGKHVFATWFARKWTGNLLFPAFVGWRMLASNAKLYCNNSSMGIPLYKIKFNYPGSPGVVIIHMSVCKSLTTGFL
jgi:hypothetical protein